MPILNETFSSLRPADQAAITAVAPLVESGAIDKFSPQAFVTANFYIALNNNAQLRWGPVFPSFIFFSPYRHTSSFPLLVTANFYIALNNNVRLRWGGCHLLRSFIVLKVIIPLVRAMKKKQGAVSGPPHPPRFTFLPRFFLNKNPSRVRNLAVV